MPLYLLENKLVLFIHVPKAGGTSVEEYLSKHYLGLLDRGFRGHLPCSPQHFHAAMLATALKDAPLDYVFMVVRNPWDRLRSEYKFRKRHFKDAKDVDFDEWVERAVAAYRKNRFHLDNHLRPMSEFLLPGTEVFKLEEGLAALRDTLVQRYPAAIDAAWRFPAVNVIDKDGEPGEAPSKKVCDLVHGLYREDFERWYPLANVEGGD
ncbi:sulfotransferase family 2 domain-containing protein [Methylomagnum ishizawai]|uniref:sulfotransferase family 2 domain-containing protein n=1 Tax=Methylomagnum ishizawai TaxID=1760988 RepID=UPI001C32DA28|nr:sulfotransferase family 2 domain-containing protein [Methylomagnum ishizawai]BBL76475.1 hypothetical protein MishRS11D_35730 [Methylomagnum ishizawai]